MPLIFKPIGLVWFFGGFCFGFCFLFFVLFFCFLEAGVLRFNLFQGQILTVGETYSAILKINLHARVGLGWLN